MLKQIKTNSKSGMTLVEVLIATVLLVMGLATFLASFSSVQRVSVTADNSVNAMHKAREILESVMAHPYDDTALNIGKHSLSDASYTVSLSPEFVTTKDIKVSVPWKSPKGGKTLYVELSGSMAKCIHE